MKSLEKSSQDTQFDTRTSILDAAEAVFSERGYGGAGMKEISGHASVAQGLLHYHFGTKEGLYAAVIERRANWVTHRRLEMLEAVDTNAVDAISQIFRAFFSPPLGPEGGGRSFARIFAQLPTGGARDQELVRRLYDPSAKVFVAALMAAYPSADKQTCAWGYSMALGLLVGSVGRSGRAEKLGDTLPEHGTDKLVERLTLHATGGFKALVEAGD